MALGGCYTCIKYLMFAFNFLYWLSGCAILGVGIWLRVDESAAKVLKESTKVDVIYTLAYVLIAIGFIIMLIGFLGCCGAIRESQCMLATFFLFLFIIFATLLGFGIWAAVAKDSFEDYVTDELKDGVNNYYTDDKHRDFMDTVQTFFKCCGHTEGDVDYREVGKIPTSCDQDNYVKFHCCGVERGRLDYEEQHDEGAPRTCANEDDKPCKDAMYKWVENNLVIIAGVSIGFAVEMILGMIFSMVLCCAIRDTVA